MFNHSIRVLVTNEFEHRDWVSSEFSHILNEESELLARISRPRGIGFATRAKTDDNNAYDTVSGKYRTRLIVNLIIITIC